VDPRTSSCFQKIRLTVSCGTCPVVAPYVTTRPPGRGASSALSNVAPPRSVDDQIRPEPRGRFPDLLDPVRRLVVEAAVSAEVSGTGQFLVTLGHDQDSGSRLFRHEQCARSDTAPDPNTSGLAPLHPAPRHDRAIRG
jgi:hypothetical protein